MLQISLPLPSLIALIQMLGYSRVLGALHAWYGSADIDISGDRAGGLRPAQESTQNYCRAFTCFRSLPRAGRPNTVKRLSDSRVSTDNFKVSKDHVQDPQAQHPKTTPLYESEGSLVSSLASQLLSSVFTMWCILIIFVTARPGGHRRRERLRARSQLPPLPGPAGSQTAERSGRKSRRRRSNRRTESWC